MNDRVKWKPSKATEVWKQKREGQIKVTSEAIIDVLESTQKALVSALKGTELLLKLFKETR